MHTRHAPHIRNPHTHSTHALTNLLTPNLSCVNGCANVKDSAKFTAMYNSITPAQRYDMGFKKTN